jgi:cytochrome c oxidase subunit 2
VSRRFLLALTLALCGCSGRQSALDPAGEQASTLHGLLSLTLVVCGVAYALVLLFLGAALWRSRRRLDPQAYPQATPGDRRLSLGLTAWAGVMTVGIFVLAGASFLVDRALARQDAASAGDVRVTGHQWWWRIEYRDPAGRGWIETANELHLPQGRPTRVEIRSADVIHSFWIPNLSGKIDMIPGRANHLTLTPQRLGWVRGQCAEFCGLQHARMALEVKVDTPQDYAAWLRAQAQPSAPASGPGAERGLTLITTGTCGSCHSIRGTSAQARAAPDLTHVASRRSLAAGTLPMTREALMGWITQPQALKPGAEMPPATLPPADVLAIASYLEGLK